MKGTLLTPDFKIPGTIRDYSYKRWGVDISSLFLREFVEYFTEGNGQGKKYVNWEIAFRNWIRRASPEGEYYNAKAWEHKIEQIKRRERPAKKYHPDPIDSTPASTLIGEIALKNIKDLLK